MEGGKGDVEVITLLAWLKDFLRVSLRLRWWLEIVGTFSCLDDGRIFGELVSPESVRGAFQSVVRHAPDEVPRWVVVFLAREAVDVLSRLATGSR